MGSYFGGEILTFEVGRGAASIGEALWRREPLRALDDAEDAEEEVYLSDDDDVEDYDRSNPVVDPLRMGRSSVPRALVFDARQPQQQSSPLEAALNAGLATFPERLPAEVDDRIRKSRLEAKKKRQSLGVSVAVPFWAGAEPAGNFHFFNDGLREGGVLGTEWWNDAEDQVRNILEKCDAMRGALFLVDTTHGGMAGIAATLLNDLEDEVKGASRLVYGCGVAEEEDNEDHGEGKSDDTDVLSGRGHKRKMLCAFSRAIAFRHLQEASHCFFPVDLNPPRTIAAALDLTTLPFRTHEVAGMRAYVTRVAGNDPTKKLATLYSQGVPLFQPFANLDYSPPPPDLLCLPRHKTKVDIIDDAAAAPTEPHHAIYLLQNVAKRLDTKKNMSARRAADHFNLHYDDLEEISADLIKLSSFYVARDSAYSFPDWYDNDDPDGDFDLDD